MSDEPEKLANGKRADGVAEYVSKHWPSTVEAAARTGLNKAQLHRLRERGALKSGRDPHRVERWDPDLLALVTEARDDGDEEDGATPQASVSSLNGQALVLLRQSQTHTEAAFKLVLEPMRQLLKAREEDVERLRARVQELEAKLDGAFELREKMLSEQHLRDLLTADVANQNARKDKALSMVREHAPKLLAAINPGAQALLAVVQSLNDEQKGLLLETDFLTPEQKTHVRAALTAAPAAADAPPPPPEPEA